MGAKAKTFESRWSAYVFQRAEEELFTQQTSVVGCCAKPSECLGDSRHVTSNQRTSHSGRQPGWESAKGVARKRGCGPPGLGDAAPLCAGLHGRRPPRAEAGARGERPPAHDRHPGPREGREIGSPPTWREPSAAQSRWRAALTCWSFLPPRPASLRSRLCSLCTSAAGPAATAVSSLALRPATGGRAASRKGRPARGGEAAAASRPQPANR